MAIGVDFASVDNNVGVDFMAAKNAGARFAIPRAIYGASVSAGSQDPFYDPTWSHYKDAIVNAGLKRSAYLFICFPQPDAEVHTPSPEAQAQALVDYVKLEPFKDMVPFIDVEQSSRVLSAGEMYEWVLRVARRLREQYGVWPGMYTSARVWADNLAHHSPGPLLACPLWLAKPWPWSARSPVHLDGAPAYSPTLIPEFGTQWFLYQYQGDAIGFPGFNKTVDASRARVFGKGSKGNHVVWAQQRLGVTADGIFGDKTEAAVKAFQAAHKLTPDGFIGLDTFTPLAWASPAPI